MKKFKRIREWMEIPGRFSPGAANSVTDVPGVTCGHFTLRENGINTGITIISPAPGDIFSNPCPAAVAAGNGFGKLTGSMQIEELGELESLIALTNTLSVAAVLQGLVDYHAARLPEDYNSISILVGETNDSSLNDIRGCHIKPRHVAEAIGALSARVEEGAAGAGAGTVCFGFKGGIGTSSRIIPAKISGEDADYTVGAIVQSNYSGSLSVYGHRLNEMKTEKDKPENGSCMIILATNAPLSGRQLKRLAKRGLIGMTNTGSVMHNGSGDFCAAFSNHEKNRRNRDYKGQSYYFLSDSQLNPFFEACADAVQEALYNSLTMAADAVYLDTHIKAFDIEDYRGYIPLL